MGVACAVRAWLHVVAEHVGFDECVTAAVENLSMKKHRSFCPSQFSALFIHFKVFQDYPSRSVLAVPSHTERQADFPSKLA